MKRPANENEGRRIKCMKKCISENSKHETYEEGEVGIIEKVTVQNFMCHENYSLNFGAHMNFIIGQNGSGKSAILTAIILALGGKSSTTDRFTNIRGFIKSGKNKGKIEVVLRNRGHLAYKPDVYGEKITIVREFTKEGSGSYKMKSESGTICSTQKAELQNIVEAMDIMVECPVCILTQATSKRFLISKDAKAERLYEFFYKGTGLEALENQYKKTDENKSIAEAELDKKIETLPELKKELCKWKRYLETSKKITDIKNEMLWASVIEMEKEVQEKEEVYRKSERELEEHKKDMELCQKSYNDKSGELDELNKQKSDLNTEMTEFRRKLKDLNAEFDDHSSSYRRAKGTLDRLENEKKKLMEDIVDLEKCINAQKLKDQKHLEEEENKRKEAVKKLTDENSILEEKLDTLSGTINTKRNEQRNMEDHVANLRLERNKHQFEAKRIQENLTTARNTIKNKVNAFGEQTENVLRAIVAEKRFTKTPIGPIGIYLDIKNPRWAAAVEFAINSSLLNSFCVDNHQDSRLLRDILRRFYSKLPAIIVSPYESQRFDVQQGRVQSRFPAVLDMITVKDHRVENCLIDQCQIEKKILIENEKERANLMKNPPTNCHSAYFMNCDQICFNPSRIYSYGNRALRSRLGVIRSEAVKEYERELEDKANAINGLIRQIESFENNVRSYPDIIKKLEQEVLKIKGVVRRNEMEIKELQCREEERNVDCLEEDLENLHQAYRKKEEEIKSCSERVSDFHAKRTELQKQRDSQSALLHASNENYNRLHIRIGDLSKRKESLALGKKKYELELKSKENICTNRRNQWEDYEKKLETLRLRAEKICPRIQTDKSSEELSRRIEQFENQVKEKSQCDRENLKKKYDEKLENFRRAERDSRRIKGQLTRIGDMLKRRTKNFHKIRKNTELLIGLAFTTILSGNGYMGNLQFSADNRTLSMEVAPRCSDNVRKNHSSLSGGERSFVTIAFLLALWERTKMPFRILDEYDVFMDSSNRQLSVDLLCEKAKEMNKTQFIFLSPLELTRMKESNDCINILKIAAPKRKNDDDENSPRKKTF